MINRCLKCGRDIHDIDDGVECPICGEGPEENLDYLQGYQNGVDSSYDDFEDEI